MRLPIWCRGISWITKKLQQRRKWQKYRIIFLKRKVLWYWALHQLIIQSNGWSYVWGSYEWSFWFLVQFSCFFWYRGCSQGWLPQISKLWRSWLHGRTGIQPSSFRVNWLEMPMQFAELFSWRLSDSLYRSTSLWLLFFL